MALPPILCVRESEFGIRKGTTQADFDISFSPFSSRAKKDLRRLFLTSATVASTSRVSEVVIVWRTMGCSLPIFTLPMVTVLFIFKRLGEEREGRRNECFFSSSEPCQRTRRGCCCV